MGPERGWTPGKGRSLASVPTPETSACKEGSPDGSIAPRSQSQDTGSPPIQMLAAAAHISVRVCIARASVCTCVQGDKGTGTPPLYRSQVR